MSDLNRNFKHDKYLLENYKKLCIISDIGVLEVKKTSSHCLKAKMRMLPATL